MHSSRSLRLGLIVIVLLLIIACSSGADDESASSDSYTIATLAPTATPLPEYTPTAEEVRVSVAKNVNCRSGPSTDYPIEVTLPEGSEVQVLGRTSASDYYYVQNPDDPGSGCWIWVDLVTFIPVNIDIMPIFTPIPLPKPPVAPVAATPACEKNASFRVQNDTGGQVTIYLTGPASFTFYVAAGSQTLSVCAGTYSYTAYGCGGASRSGTVGNGDEIEFWCE